MPVMRARRMDRLSLGYRFIPSVARHPILGLLAGRQFARNAVPNLGSAVVRSPPDCTCAAATEVWREQREAIPEDLFIQDLSVAHCVVLVDGVCGWLVDTVTDADGPRCGSHSPHQLSWLTRGNANIPSAFISSGPVHTGGRLRHAPTPGASDVLSRKNRQLPQHSSAIVMPHLYAHNRSHISRAANSDVAIVRTRIHSAAVIPISLLSL